MRIFCDTFHACFLLHAKWCCSHWQRVYLTFERNPPFNLHKQGLSCLTWTTYCIENHNAKKIQPSLLGEKPQQWYNWPPQLLWCNQVGKNWIETVNNECVFLILCISSTIFKGTAADRHRLNALTKGKFLKQSSFVWNSTNPDFNDGPFFLQKVCTSDIKQQVFCVCHGNCTLAL